MQILNKIKTFYVFVFSYVIKKLKLVVQWNKSKLGDVRTHWENGQYIRAITKGLMYVSFIVLQFILFLLILVSYLLCKITGVCLII